jgi:alpha-glucosidase
MTWDLGPRQNRDRSRTPMRWNASARGGFSAGPAAPWLPVGDASAGNVADQREDATSVLTYCRELIKLRKAEIGADLRYRQLTAPPGVWCYAVGQVTVAANFTEQAAAMPELRVGRRLMSSLGDVSGETTDGVSLGPGEAIVARSGK